MIKNLTSASLLLAGLFAACLALADGMPSDIEIPIPDDSAIIAQSKLGVTKAPSISTRDATKVAPAVAVKTPATVETIVLPGVLDDKAALATALDFSRARVVVMDNGGSKTVYISDTEVNRIQLPFVNPKVIQSKSKLGVIDRSESSNNVYVFAKTKEASQVFFESAEGDAVIGLQLVPKAIPSQTIIIEALQTKPVKKLIGGTHISNIQDLMETVVSGKNPQGFVAIDIDYPPIVKNELLIEVARKFSDQAREIYLYKITNQTNVTVNLQEKEFDGMNVEAISIYPKAALSHSDSTWVAVMAKKVRP